MLVSSHPLARAALLALTLLGGRTAAAVRWPQRLRLPPLLALPAFGLASFAAGFLAWIRALSGRASAVWEPTRRSAQAATNHPA
jgi:hypothetical protein